MAIGRLCFARGWPIELQNVCMHVCLYANVIYTPVRGGWVVCVFFCIYVMRILHVVYENLAHVVYEACMLMFARI
jgi:hypothetical protein